MLEQLLCFAEFQLGNTALQTRKYLFFSPSSIFFTPRILDVGVWVQQEDIKQSNKTRKKPFHTQSNLVSFVHVEITSLVFLIPDKMSSKRCLLCRMKVNSNFSILVSFCINVHTNLSLKSLANYNERICSSFKTLNTG